VSSGVLRWGCAGACCACCGVVDGCIVPSLPLFPRTPPPPSSTPPPPPPHRDRFLDDFLIALRRKLPTTSAAGLSTVVSALPSLSSGVRLNEIVADARARYEALTAAQQQQDAAYAAEYEQQQQQDLPAAPEAVAA